jgi:iron complex transport system substrate-binding protein
MIDLERIVLLKPDLVVTWPYTTPAQVDRLRQRGIAVFITDPKTIEGIASNLDRLGVLVGREARAREAAGTLRSRVLSLRREYAGRRVIPVFYEIWPTPLYTVGGEHLITQALAICGAHNVFGALTLPAPLVSVEAVLAAAPEAIVAAADDGVRPDWLDQWKRWPLLPAVAKGNLIVADGNLLHRPGPRFIDGVAQLCKSLDAVRRKDTKSVTQG